MTAPTPLRDRIAARLFQTRRDTTPLGFPPHLRYLRPIASGAAGDVHLATDPTLDRPVAVKLLRARADPSDLRRLHREARTLARLAHPNVVHVYEVGEHDGRLFLVMEYVDGSSLLERQREPENPPTFDQLVHAYVEAAQGIAAAHAAGIVHRDIKPANLLIGKDGRVRVADFGLAHPLEDPTDPRPARPATDPTDPDPRKLAVDDAPLVGPIPPLATESRQARGGTPAYMAPETLSAGIADARSDQFSWAVSFYEAIYGNRPRARLGHPLELDSDAGPHLVLPAKRPGGQPVPRFVRDALRQALAWDPRQRAASLDHLARELLAGPARVRRRSTVAAAFLAVIATGGGAYAIARSATACPRPDELIVQAWDPETEQRITDAFAATQLPFAERAATFATTALAKYARQWATAKSDACETTRTRAERSEEFLDLANACLEVRRAQHQALVADLSVGREIDVASIDALVATLAPIEPCGNPAALREARESAFDPALATEFAEIRDILARARTAFARGAQPEALRLVDLATTRATASRAPAILAEALLTSGQFRRAIGDGGRAVSTLLAAVDTAEAANAQLTKTDALLELVHAQADLTEDAEKARYHLDRGRAALLRLEVDPDAHPPWLAALAVADEAEHDPAAAEATLRWLLEHHRAMGDTLAVATTLARLGRVLEEGRRVEARAAYQEATALFSEQLGPRHPRTVSVGFNLGLLEQADGNLEAAASAFETLRDVTTEALGPDAAPLATVHNALSDLANLEGQHERAIAEASRALAIEAGLVFPEPSVMGAAHTALSNAHRALGNVDAALTHTKTAMALLENSLAEQELAEYRINVGEYLCSESVKRCAGAFPYYADAADATRSASKGDPHRVQLFAYSINGLGKVALASGSWTSAVMSYRAARDIATRDLDAPDQLLNAEIAWGLAQALRSLGAPKHEAPIEAVTAYAACVLGGLVVRARGHDGPFTPTPCGEGATPEPVEG